MYTTNEEYDAFHLVFHKHENALYEGIIEPVTEEEYEAFINILKPNSKNLGKEWFKANFTDATSDSKGIKVYYPVVRGVS